MDCNDLASAHITYTSTGILKYRETSANGRTASSGKRCPIYGLGDLLLNADVSVVKCLDCFAMLLMYLASAALYFP